MEKKYWIIVDGKPQGPFSADELRLRRDFTSELPVWTTGMADWTTAGQVEELSVLIGESVEISELSEQSEKSEKSEQSEGRRWVSEATVEQGEPMPSSYLGWNIAMTLCCCLPFGIAGIFFSSMVSQKWYRGDIEGAKKASDRAAWCLILSIVLGLVCWPFQMLVQMGSL